MKKSLFEQLSPENQQKVTDFNFSGEVTDSLNHHKCFTQLNARDLYMLAEIFGFNQYDISFANAMLSISQLFD